MDNKRLHFLIETLVGEAFLDEAKIDKFIKDNPDYSDVLEQFRTVKPKYLPWILQRIKSALLTNINFSGPEFDNEDWPVYYKSLIDQFDELSAQGHIDKSNKDIGKFKSGWSLQKALETAEERKQSKAKEKQAKKFYEDETYLIIQPQSKEASCVYGKGTKWCISAKVSNQFDSYKSDGAEFLFIINKKTGDKDAFSYLPKEIKDHPEDFETFIEIYDAADNEIYLRDLHAKYPQKIINMLLAHMGVENILRTYQSDFDSQRLPDASQTANMLAATDEDAVQRFKEGVLETQWNNITRIKWALKHKRNYPTLRKTLQETSSFIDNLYTLRQSAATLSKKDLAELSKEVEDFADFGAYHIKKTLDGIAELVGSGEFSEEMFSQEKIHNPNLKHEDFVEPWVILDQILKKMQLFKTAKFSFA